MSKVDEFLSDTERWKIRAQQAERRRKKLRSFGPNALGVLVKAQQGLFVVDPEDGYVSHTLLHEGVYNQSEYDVAKSFVTKRGNVLVVGSHIGTHAIALSRGCRRLVAIEANPRTFTFLKANILLNECSNIEAYNVAAGERARKIPFLMSRDNSGGSMRGPLKKVMAAYVYDNPETIRIDAVPLDDLLGARAFDLILMDVEGWEHSALKGMPQVLSKAKALSIEFLPYLLRHICGITPRKLLSVILPHFDWMYIPSGNVVVPKDQIVGWLEAMYRAEEGHDGIYFLKTRPRVYVSAVKFSLPAPWQAQPLPCNLRNAGWYSKVADKNIAVEAMLSAIARSRISDVAAYAHSRKAALLNTITDPAPLEDLHEIYINGRHAYRYVVTGINTDGQAVTFVGTIIEEKNDIAVMLAYTVARNYSVQKEVISRIADHLVGFR